MSDQRLEISQSKVPEVPEGRGRHVGLEEAERIQEKGTPQGLRVTPDEARPDPCQRAV